MIQAGRASGQGWDPHIGAGVMGEQGVPERLNAIAMVNQPIAYGKFDIVVTREMETMTRPVPAAQTRRGFRYRAIVETAVHSVVESVDESVVEPRISALSDLEQSR